MSTPLTKDQKGDNRRNMLSPFSPWTSLKHDMDSWFGNSDVVKAYDQYDFSPCCDMKENKKEYVLSFDIPGVKKKDIKTQLKKTRLSVLGERRSESEGSIKKYYFAESLRGTFMRSVTLPYDVDGSEVRSSYKNGVLTVKIHKIPPIQGRQSDDDDDDDHDEV